MSYTDYDSDSEFGFGYDSYDSDDSGYESDEPGYNNEFGKWPSFSWNKKHKKRPTSFDSVSTGFSDDGDAGNIEIYDSWAFEPCDSSEKFDIHNPYHITNFKKVHGGAGRNCYRRVLQNKHRLPWSSEPCESTDYFDPNNSYHTTYYKKTHGGEGSGCYRKTKQGGSISRDQLYDLFLNQASKLLAHQGYNPNNGAHQKKFDNIFLEYENSLNNPNEFWEAHAIPWFKNKFSSLYFNFGTKKRPTRTQRAKRRSVKK